MIEFELIDENYNEDDEDFFIESFFNKKISKKIIKKKHFSYFLYFIKKILYMLYFFKKFIL